MSEWIEVGKLEDIPKLGSRVVNTADGNIAVFRNARDEVFALKDQCPHKGGPLSQGMVHDRSVTCPLHNWVLGLDDGAAKGPDEGCTPTYAIKINDDVIFIAAKPNS